MKFVPSTLCDKPHHSASLLDKQPSIDLPDGWKTHTNGNQMKARIIRLILAITISSSVGCAMCCGPYDYDYPTLGGKHERADRSFGRVGSVLSDPMAFPNGGDADSNLKRADERKKRDPSEILNEDDRSREGLEEIDPSRPAPNQETLPSPDTKEAFNQYQRPRPLSQWR